MLAGTIITCKIIQNARKCAASHRNTFSPRCLSQGRSLFASVESCLEGQRDASTRKSFLPDKDAMSVETFESSGMKTHSAYVPHLCIANRSIRMRHGFANLSCRMLVPTQRTHLRCLSVITGYLPRPPLDLPTMWPAWTTASPKMDFCALTRWDGELTNRQRQIRPLSVMVKQTDLSILILSAPADGKWTMRQRLRIGNNFDCQQLLDLLVSSINSAI